jgi:hypothetical protein
MVLINPILAEINFNISLADEYYSFKGVPANSVARKYPNDYLKDE